MKKFDFDLIIVGSGSAGRTAAIMAASAKQKVALVEANTWGGSKINNYEAPLMTAQVFANTYAAAMDGVKLGISSSNLKYNYPTVLNWRRSTLKRIEVKKDLKESGITMFEAKAHFLSSHELAAGNKRISAKKFLIATGTKLKNPEIYGIYSIEELRNHNNESNQAGFIRAFAPGEVMKLNRLPKVVMVIGAGKTGCEIADYLSQLGIKVILVEKTDRILPKEEIEVSQIVHRNLERRQNIQIVTRAKVLSGTKSGVVEKVVFLQENKEKSVNVEAVVLATGLAPETDLGLENAGVKYDENGIIINSNLQTSAKHIYAAGSVTGNCDFDSMEKSSYEGALATSNIINNSKSKIDLTGFTRIIHTNPKVAVVGMSEKECRMQKIKYKTALVEASGILAAKLTGEIDGFVKLIVDKDTKVLGATMVGVNVEGLQMVALATKIGIKAIHLASTPHVITSWGEMIRLAARKLAK